MATASADNLSEVNVPSTEVSSGGATDVPMATPEAIPDASSNVLLQGFNRLPRPKKVQLLVALAAALAFIIIVIIWSIEPNYKLLFGKLSEQSSGEIAQFLKQQNIPYKLDENSGEILVPADQVHEIRLHLATEGLPNADDDGFEMLDKNRGFGTSQFMEKVRYQRAIEGELARSVKRLKNVESARVHLAIPKQSVFIRNRKDPSASVLVNLARGKSLSDDQVAAVVHLVAASIPDLKAEKVTVVDQTGKMLTKKNLPQDMILSSAQFEYKQKLESYYIERIERILSPIVGFEGVRAQVDAMVDFSVTETTQETFNPDLPSVRSENTVEEESRGGMIGGIPGALTNQPPGAAVAPERAGNENAKKNVLPSRRSKRSSFNYELDKSISHTRFSPGKLQRLSVAVVVDDKSILKEDGTIGNVALTPEELNQITLLVRETVGFDVQRGDSLNVTNVFFQEEKLVVEEPELPIWQQTWFLDLAKQVLAIFAILMAILLIVRPVIKALKYKEVTEEEHKKLPQLDENGNPIPGSELEAVPAGKENVDGEEGGETDEENQQRLQDGEHDKMLEAIKKLVQDDPKLVAQVIKNWVGNE